jgi:hypothetical protein
VRNARSTPPHNPSFVCTVNLTNGLHVRLTSIHLTHSRVSQMDSTSRRPGSMTSAQTADSPDQQLAARLSRLAADLTFTLIRTRRQLIEAYLYLDGFNGVRSEWKDNFNFSMHANGLHHSLGVSPAWMASVTRTSVKHRLQKLNVFARVRTHRGIRLHIAPSGQEILEENLAPLE